MLCYIANNLQYATKNFLRVGRPVLAALLVGIALLLDAMAVCPALHELIHKDAGKADHHCAVTLLAQGKMHSVTCEIVPPEPTLLVETTKPFSTSVFSSAIENLPQGRAPPAVSSPQV